MGIEEEPGVIGTEPNPYPQESNSDTSWVRRNLTPLVLCGALAVAGSTDIIRPDKASAAAVPAGATASPAVLSKQAKDLVGSTSVAWLRHQSRDGRFTDPVKGKSSSYGTPMIGQALIETGVLAQDSNLINSGIRAQLSQISHPDNGGYNVAFERLGMAEAYGKNEKLLADYPFWQKSRAAVAQFVQARGYRGFNSRTSDDSPSFLKKCFSIASCYNNLKLVGAAASREVVASNIPTRDVVAIASSSSKKSSISVDRILRLAVRHTSSDSRLIGNDQKAGFLSDPPSKFSIPSKSVNPLGYNALSAEMLGGILDNAEINESTASLKSAFLRTARTIAGSMSPSGDLDYVGRAQGQVWVPAIATAALAKAIKYEDSPAWRNRYLVAIDTLLTRIATKHRASSGWGLALAPRLAGKTI